MLYGLAEQRDALLAGARPVLVEGPMDVLAVAATNGSTSRPGPAVAPCGTALTAAQLDVLGAPRPAGSASWSRSTATTQGAGPPCALTHSSPATAVPRT